MFTWISEAGYKFLCDLHVHWASPGPHAPGHSVPVGRGRGPVPQTLLGLLLCQVRENFTPGYDLEDILFLMDLSHLFK